MTNDLKVEVVYALPDRQIMKRLNVAKGTTAENAIVQSGILDMFPEIDLAKNRYGIRSFVLAMCSRRGSMLILRSHSSAASLGSN
jgi:putative ubiquitin-RnfH superfamily antitoxin RatB of RatAB toxin-antitoxin module